MKFAKTSPSLSRMALAGFAAIALAACGSEAEDTGAPPEGDPIAAIEPPEGQEWTEVARETEEGGFVIGNPDAPIKLVEYASHTCVHCGDFSENASAPLREKYVSSGVVSYEIRNQIHDPIDLTTSMLARCSGPEAFHPLAEQFWANLNSVFDRVQENQEAFARASQVPEEQRYQQVAEAAGLIDFFAARGIPRDQAMQCLADPSLGEAILERSNTQSEELDVTGTPTFFLNGRLVELSNDPIWPQVEAALQAAGAR